MHSHSDHSGHHHHHSVQGEDEGTSLRLWISIILNLIITITEVIGGIVANSLALLSDALHNLSDTTSLGISLIARKISRKEADKSRTFGYKRAEIIGAFINLLTLVIIALFLIKEGVERFFDPREIQGNVMLIVAIVGLLGNLGTAAVLMGRFRSSINLKSVFVHIVSDALSSVGVIIGGWLIMQYGIYWVDSLLTLIIGAYILVHSYGMLRTTIDILMESTPREIEWDKVNDFMEQIDGVQGIHHLHIWRLDEQNICLEAHVVINKRDLEALEKIKTELKEKLKESYNINHSTLEFEFEPCEEDDLLAD